MTKLIINKKNIVKYAIILTISLITTLIVILIYNKFTNVNETYTNYAEHKPIHYVYWTGGYDSTFRLCEMLINENKMVQPIYIAFNLDNSCKGDSCKNKLWLRRNRIQEQKAMKTIRKKLITKYPHVKTLLQPTIFVNNDIDGKQYNIAFKKKFYSNNLWPKKRKVHQYYFLAKYANYYKRYVDTGVLGIHKDSKFYRYLRDNLVQVSNNWIINDTNSPISYLNFPLFGRTKEMLLEKAKMFEYDDILTYTWSCWFPKTGKPCGKCPMCRERIINHPELNDEKKLELLEPFEDKEPVQLFWTGGYDSTFRLCELLLIDKVPVQTIYISADIDDDLSNPSAKYRHSTKNELNSIKNIRTHISTSYPELSHLLLPTKYIKKIKISEYIKSNMTLLADRNMIRRSTCQYGAMAQYTNKINKDVEVCIVKETISSQKKNTIYHSIKNKLICNYGKCPLNERKLNPIQTNWYKPLLIFKHFVFPLYTLSKEDLYIIAKKHRFLNILKMTWSCWYPDDNGKPCNKCIMCRERII